MMFVPPLEYPKDGYCYVQNYVDVQPESGGQDCYGLARSYEKHRGTDFRVSYNAMLDGVHVLAAADGVVVRTRDGMEDTYIISMAKDVNGQECGNGVILDHGNGWQTQYCHLKEGSVRVQQGDRVAVGEPIGAVGLSGKTEFAHVHFQVTHNGTIVCPFSGEAYMASAEVPDREPLWADVREDMLRYTSPQLLRVDYSDFLPDSSRDVLRRPRFTQVLNVGNNPVVFSVVMAMLNKGDHLVVRLSTLDGVEIAKKVVDVTTFTPQRFDFVGRKDSQNFVGKTLEGCVELWRDGTQLVEHRSVVAIR
ncbi:MAG: M23 family metallopeptidase [Desulfovibrionales bacterium]|nr:M23 family metallopeptidase [Desulfovibrionales bacterium]